MVIDQKQILDAENRIRPWLTPTPVIRSTFLSERTGTQVFFKLEMVQPTHSFKARGAFNAILALPDEVRQRGVITASGGNHGLGVALAARSQNIPATIYLPVRTPAVKIEAIRKLGGQVVLYGQVWDEANRKAMEVAAQEGMTYIHPFDNPYVMSGQATIVRELNRQLPRIDLLVASIGGGGLISGLLSAAKHWAPATRIVGVETIGADCMYASRAAGHIVELPAITSIADSLGAKKTEKTQFDIVMENISDLVEVSDESAIRALLELLREDKLLVEPACSCSVAALLEGKIAFRPGETIVIVMCGSNVALDQVVQWHGRYAVD